MDRTERLDEFQRRHPWLGFPIAVIYKYADDQGVYLAALITYYGFLSLFPLLMLLVSGVGFLFQHQPELQSAILDSALGQFPVIGRELDDPAGLQGSTSAVVFGAAIALYGSMRAAQAIQHASDVCWAVPRHRRPNPILARLRSAVLIGVVGLALLLTTVLSAVAGSARAYDVGIEMVTAVLLTALAVAGNCAVIVLVMRFATVRSVSVREVLPGALTAAVGWQLLQSFGAAYVARVVKNTGDTYGVFALVLGLMAWLFMAGVVLVMSLEINVVRAKGLYPRSLLTPFTEDVDLTEADRQTYTEAAESTRAKESEEVDVTFEGHRSEDRDSRPPL